LQSACGYFGLNLTVARLMIKEVAEVTKDWRKVAASVGVKPSEVNRMESAFEHGDLKQALAL
jgi:serine/threonine-protein kinase HipA